jgi:uncharacterized protein DUF4242
MAEFVLEFYVPRIDGGAGERAERARRAAEDLTREGTPVRYLRSILLPEEETCLMLYEAASAGDVRAAAGRASLPLARVTEAVSEPGYADGAS